MYYLLDPGTITFPISTYICLFNVRVYVQINYMAKQECKIIVICQYCLSVCSLTNFFFLVHDSMNITLAEKLELVL